ncbi:MAG: efflux RND transporter permease subunit, partial [Balneolales bacterium]
LLLKRPITAIMLIIATFIFGYVALTELSVDLLPDVDAPTLLVQAEWSGASAREIEMRINEPLEGALSSIPNLVGSQSYARQGMGFIALEFEWGHNMNLAFLNAREKLDQVRYALPQQADRPTLVYSNPSDEPVAVLSVTSRDQSDPDYDTRLALKNWTEQILSRRLEQEDGVAQAITVGALKPQVRIQYNPRLIDRYDLTIDEIQSRVSDANLQSASGELQDGWYRYSLNIESRINSLDDLNRLPLKTVGGERILRLSDVAEIRMDEEDPTSFSMVDGNQVLTVMVKKDYDSNLVQVYQHMLPILDQLQEQYPGIDLRVLSENATFIDNTIKNLLQTLLLGGVLAFFVLFFFLNDPRMPFTIGIAIPVSIFLTFFVMYLAGIQLNIISLSGLTLGIGLLVDNAIVVLENINRHKAGRRSLFEAAATGTKEISLAVTASTFTTISVFLPLVFLGGFEGAFFRDQALTLSISLLASLLVALMILPVLVLKFKGKSPNKRSSPTLFTRGIERALSTYESMLSYSLKNPLPVIGCFLLAAVLAVLAFLYIPKELIPSTEEQKLRYRVTLPGNTALFSSRRAAISLGDQLQSAGNLSGVMVLGGYTDETNLNRLADEGLNRFTMEIPVSSPEHAGRVRERMSEITQNQPDWSVEPLSALPLFENLLGQSPAPVVVQIVGLEREYSALQAQELRESLQGMDESWELDLHHAEQVDTYHLHFLQDRLLFYNITENDVIDFMESTARGNLLTEWTRNDESIEIRMFSNRNQSFSPDELVIPSRGRNIPLRELARIERVAEPEQLERVNQTPVLSYLSGITMADWSWNRAEIQETLDRFSMESGLEVMVTGTAIQIESLLNDMRRLLMISLILIYIILAIQYENLKYPMIILFSVPFAWIGSMLILWSFGVGLNILSFMGILILTGIAVNDAILKVDFMRRYYEETGELKEAIHKAGRHRFRPVVMTTLTTILGLLPMVIPIGDGYEFRQALALALMGGMISSTALTLFLIPMIFGWIHKENPKTEQVKA